METNSLVQVWEEKITIPTYGIGKPEKNPIFLENRVYQGSSGVVYPHPVIEKILDDKEDKVYHALFLENTYLKIMILPELGGRIQMAFDKIRNRHFIYYNRVIKPALVGLTGPWISGGIEFNWPQHHRPSTFDPIDYTIEEHSDGSKTVWVSEVERMFRTKGMAGFRLYPDKAYLEINAKLYNRTPFSQTFLWWANPAVKVNDDYQSVFPPDVNAVFDHGKRDVSEFPIAKGTYYKVDYSKGVDISRYKNIPVPTSYMAIKSKYDFMGGYEHDTRGGLLHVANHHVSPGKKQWTWGKGEFGFAWDRNLTDEDGPYIELMTGVFTDNQPDFSWIQPFEERTFTQYFMPYSELGVVKNATKDAFVNLEMAGNSIDVKLYTTTVHQQAHVILLLDEQEIWSEYISISPENPYNKTIAKKITLPEKLKILLIGAAGNILVQYQPEANASKDIPAAAKPALEPKAITSIEQLFLAGLHIEQYRHATFKATDYYQEALRREPGDVRSNNAMGLWLLKRAKFTEAEKYFNKAIQTLTERNPNPYDGEPYFNLGLCLHYQERHDEAFDAWYKCTWNVAWQDAAFLNLARIACRKNNFEEALSLVNKSLNRNYTSQVARHLKTVILRKLNRIAEALQLAEESLQLDKFSLGCIYEEYLLYRALSQKEKAGEKLEQVTKISRQYVHNYIEYALDYAHAGFYPEAIGLLTPGINIPEEVYPMVYYFRGYFEEKNGDLKAAIHYYQLASKAKPDYCFPNRIEEAVALQAAIAHNPDDAKAPYYLGNFWYANRQYTEAVAAWERSGTLDHSFPTVHRNLALAYHNKLFNHAASLQSLEKAFSLDTSDARVLMELDQLYKKLNKPHTERLALLEKYIALTESRDDLYLERITLYNLSGDHAKALSLITARKFHPWEGGEGKVVGQYLVCLLELAKASLAEGHVKQALDYLERAQTYPHNLGEGKLYGAQENDIFYLSGCAMQLAGNIAEANVYFKKATVGLSEPVQAIYYNDQQPDKIFYQGLAWNKLGQPEKAEAIFKRLISFGEQHLHDTIKIDYFAVSLPDLLVFDQDLNLRNQIHCHYLMALGYLGLNHEYLTNAEKNFNFVLAHDVNHVGAVIHRKMITQPSLMVS
jgi:tetratricopeptide (TPR) repeat protein